VSDKRRTIVISLILIVTVVIAGVFNIGGISRLYSEGIQGSMAVRFALWRDSFKLFISSPLIGYGSGTFSRSFPLFQSSGVWSNHAHSFLIEIMCENGIIGLLLFLIVIFYGIYGKGFERLASIVLLLLHSSIDFTLSAPSSLLLLFFLFSEKKDSLYTVIDIVLLYVIRFLLIISIIILTSHFVSEVFYKFSNKLIEKDISAAIRYAGFARLFEPVSADRYILLSNLNMEYGRRTGEKIFIEKAIEYSKDAEFFERTYYLAHLQMGLALISSGKVEDGLKSLYRATELYPDLALIYSITGSILNNIGRKEEALSVLNRGAGLAGGYKKYSNPDIMDVVDILLLRCEIIKDTDRDELRFCINSTLKYFESIRMVAGLRRTREGKSLDEAIKILLSLQ